MTDLVHVGAEIILWSLVGLGIVGGAFLVVGMFYAFTGRGDR